ncbi:MAG: type II toxin-antitoxin system RelE/ParE family toxin [Solobacterium sp.]|nr:type II toxin-antitoxin system RelE/ParE family toxin [Solobacterium sp.]
MRYSINRTDTADSLLNRLILNVADRFSTQKAFDVLDTIEEKVNLLQDTPYIGTEPKYMVLKRQGYRVLILDLTLVFYKVDDSKKEVMIYAFVDSRMDYLPIIMGLWF